VRIIAGTKRAMKLFSPKEGDSRPITDRVKESLFDVLFNYGLPEEQIVADLFCGVGSLGLEALSRGARFVTLVEKDPNVAAVLRKNIEKANFTSRARVIKADAFKVGAPLFDQEKYGMVFVDPPYAATGDVGPHSRLAGLLEVLSGQIAPDALVVVRTRHTTELLDRYGRLSPVERRRWGTMAVTMLRFTQNDK